MWRLIVLTSILLLSSASLARGQSSWQQCLPKDVKATDVVSVERGKYGNAVRKLTVKQQLKKLKARCRKGKLFDSRGMEIYFYRLAGCWGNPPMDYQNILERQRNELSELKKRYTVIEMTCNTSTKPIL
jgi:hypothetical protein